MYEDFFSKAVQDSLKSCWGDPSDFADNVAIGFMAYYTRMDNLPYKSFRYRVGDFKFSSHLAWWYPSYTSSLSIKITVDELTNSNVILGTETGFNLQQPYGIELAHLPLNPGEQGVFVSKSWFSDEKPYTYRSLDLVYTKGKKYKNSRKYNSFTLFPERCIVNSDEKDRFDYDTGDFRNFSTAIGWEAVSAEAIDEYTLRVYLTDAPYQENIDFHNLVLQLQFSETLEACRVGFNDIPNYFGEIASRGVDGETVLRERFG